MKKTLLLTIGVILCFIFSCTKEVTMSSEKQIVEFTIGIFGPNANGKVDEVAKTITFEVPPGTDVTKLAPMIKVSPLATITPAIGETQDFTNPVSYTVIAEDGTKQVYVVKVVVLKSEEKSMLSFKLAGLNPEVEGAIDEAKKTVKLSVPFGTSVTELIPTITFSKSATVTPATGVKQDFTKPVTYTVTAESGSKQEYVVTVEVGKNSEKSITEFKLTGLNPEVVGAIDEVKKTVLLSVPFGTNIKELAPAITTSKNATVTPATGIKQDFTKPVTYTVTAENGVKQTYIVTVESGKNSEKSITEFKFAGLTPEVVGTIDEVKKTVNLLVPFGTNVKDLVPSITSSKNAAVTPATGVKQDFTNSVTYTVTAENGSKQEYVVTVESGKNSEKSITEFKFAGLTPEVEGTIDEVKKTVKLLVPYGTNVKELVPSITSSKNAAVIPATGVKQDFTNSVTYTVTAENGSKQEYVVSVESGRNSDKSITGFKFDGLIPEVVGTIDEVKKTVTLLVPYGTNVKELVPSITLSTNAAVNPATAMKQDFTNSVTYTVTAENGSKQEYIVTVKSGMNSEKNITGFKLAGLTPEVVGVVNEAEQTVMLNVPSGVDITALVPTITLSKSATVLPASGDKQDFTKAVVYTVMAEDGSKKDYTISVNVVRSDAKKLLSFKLAGLTPEVEGVVVEADHTVTLSVPSNTNVTALVPAITMSDKATITPALGIAQDFTKPVTYTVTAENGSAQAYAVTVNVAQNSDKNITEFKFASFNPAVVATIDQNNKTITAKVPFGANLKALVPSILVSGGAMVLPLSGSAVDFSSAVTYTVTAQDGSATPYSVTVTVDRNLEAKISKFAFDKQNPAVGGTINESDKTIMLTVPLGTNITNLIPSISASEKATISPASGVAVDFTNEVTYKVTSESGVEVAYSVKVAFAKSDEAKISEFKLDKLNPAVSGTIDQAAKTILLTVPFGTNITSLIPAISASEKATISPASGVAVDFTNEVTYKVTSESGVEVAYSVKVAFAKSDEAKISEFKLDKLNPAVSGTIDQAAKTILLTVPFGTNVTNLTPSVSASEKATVLPASGAAVDFTNAVTYTVKSESGIEVPYTVTVKVGLNVEAKISNFAFDKLSPVVGGAIDESAKTILLTVPSGTNVTSLIPAISVSEKATISPASGVAVDFTNEVIYKVTSESGVDATYTVKVAVQKFVPAITSVSSINVPKGTSFTLNGSFVPGNTVVTLEGVGGSSVNLAIVTETAAQIKATIPKETVDGSYKLSVAVDGEKATYAASISVNDGKPKITSLNKSSLLAGSELVITGVNLKKVLATTYILVGSYKDASGKVKVTIKGVLNSDGTEVRANIPGDVPAGATTVKVQVGTATNVSNEMGITITENTFTAPVVNSVSATEIIAGNELVITGSNFMEKGNKVKLVNGSTIYTLDASSESATSITIPTARDLKSGNYDLSVISNGRETPYSVSKINVNQVAVFKTVSPTSLKSGETITITGENLNKDTFSFLILSDKNNESAEYSHKITFVNSTTVTVNVGTLAGGTVQDMAPGKYIFDVKAPKLNLLGKIDTKSVYTTEIEIIK